MSATERYNKYQDVITALQADAHTAEVKAAYRRGFDEGVECANSNWP